MLTKDSEFNRTKACGKSFLQLKIFLTQAPILQGLKWSLPFHIHTDASDYTIGVVLGHKDNSIENAIYFISKNLQRPELIYTVTEKELLAVAYALNKFRHYVTGYQIFFHIDHAAIRYLMNKPTISGRLARWLLLLQEFDITIIDKPGRANVIVDFLSRLQSTTSLKVIDDYFLDENLFSIVAHTP